MEDELPYDLPQGWRRERIGNLVLKAKQRDPRKAPHERFAYVDVSSVSNESFKITESASLVGKDAPSRARKEIRRDDVLFATVRPTLRRVALVPEKLDGQIASTGYCVLRSDRSKVDPRYLYSFLLTDGFIARMAGLERGAGYPAVRESDVFGSELPLPPLAEQQRIAQVLSTVQSAIEQQERLIRTTTELKQTLMQKLFTEGLRGEAQKETEIGLVPESWEVVKVMDTGTVVTGSTPSTSREDFYGGEYNLISPGDLDVTKYVTMVQKKLTALGFDQCRKLPIGAVLVGCIGNVGKVGMVADDRSATNQQINAIIPNDKHNGEFLYYAMDFHRNRLESLAGKVTIPLVNKSNFERFEIAAPLLNEQVAIAKALDAVDQRVTVAEKKRNALQALFRTLLHELMTGKVRVGAEGKNH